MRYLKTFEELNPRFGSKEEKSAFYKAKALAAPVRSQLRIVNPDNHSDIIFNDSYLEIKPNDTLMLLDKDGVEVKNPLFSVNESVENGSLVTVITEGEFDKFNELHKQLTIENSDIDVFCEFLYDLYKEDSDCIELHKAGIDKSGYYYVPISGAIDTDETYVDGEFSFFKYDDDWYVVTESVYGWNNDYPKFYLVDTLDGIKELVNYVNE